MTLHTTLGVQRQIGAHFGRSTPICCPFLALNARTMLVLGVQRQLFSRVQFGRSNAQMLPILGVQCPDTAHFGRSAPEPCSVLALNARQMLPPGCDFSSAVFDSVFNFYIYFVTPHDHVPNKT